MTAFLPPNLLALFAPRNPIPFLQPLDKPRHLKRPWPYSGVAQYLTVFEVRSWDDVDLGIMYIMQILWDILVLLRTLRRYRVLQDKIMTPVSS